MFNDCYGLTQAVLEGRKTKTRRLCKDFATKEVIYAAGIESWRQYTDENIVEFVLKDGSVRVAEARYKIGEVVAVAQSGSDIYHALQQRYGKTSDAALGFMEMCNNKMFVPADLMPHQIKITDIRVERLQNISDEDCLCEGVEYSENFRCYYVRALQNKDGVALRYVAPRAVFSVLIDKVNGTGTWDCNPYVFVYGFKLVQ